MAFMPWNNEVVKSLYPSVAEGFVHRIGNRTNLNQQTVANAIRSLVKETGADPQASSTLLLARELTAGQPSSSKPYLSPTFGYLAQWTSEMSGGDDLDALLRHADLYLNPTWVDGGLFYARCDVGEDEQGNYTFVDAYTGNGGIGYARLNVKDGQKRMWDEPWSKEEVEARPWIDGVYLDQDVDCLRGVWDVGERAMVVSLRTWNGSTKNVQLSAYCLPVGTYGIYENGKLRRVVEIMSALKPLVVDLVVTQVGVDLVIKGEI